VESQNCSILEKLTRILKFFLNTASNNFNYFQLIFATHAPPSEKLGPIEEEFNSRPNILISEVVRIIKAAIDQGEMKPIDPLNCTYFLWGVMYGNIQTINRIKIGRLGDYLIFEEFAINEMRKYIKTLLKN